jgi:hypothetical protein
MEELDLGGDLTYSERPIKILDIAERVTRSKVIKMCKVQWSHHTEDEATWEHEEELRADYPELFPSASWNSGRDSSKGGRFVTPTFYKNEIFCPHRSAYKNCISNYSTYEKLPKINLVYDALHGMAYYIFLKSLRSPEEFRKHPHVKIPPKSPSTHFQSLGKFKNPILIRNFFFLIFGLADPVARLASGPARPPAASSP